MPATIVTDALWGDAGKGLVCAHVALRDKALGIFRGGVGPNAEHGIFVNGVYLKTNQLPMGFIFSGAPIGIGPGTAVDPVKLLAEMKRFHIHPDMVKIDPRCPIVTSEHIEREMTSTNMEAVHSTRSGSGACHSDYVLRTAQQARDFPELAPYLADIPEKINSMCSYGTVMVESSQGAQLSRSFSYDYPNVTSCDVTTLATAASVGLNWQEIDRVIMIVKALPTREGAGNMGNVEEFTVEEQIALGIAEYSSITDGTWKDKDSKGQIRRKTKGIDWELLAQSAQLNGPTEIALSFAEHYDREVSGAKRWSQITTKVKDLIRQVENVCAAPVTLVNTGKNFDCMVSARDDLTTLTPDIINRLERYTR